MNAVANIQKHTNGNNPMPCACVRSFKAWYGSASWKDDYEGF